MVAHFKMETLAVVEGQPDRLTEVDGIGRHRAQKIAAAFAEHRHVQDVMVFLLGHGVSIGFAARIVKRYGKDAIKIVRANPYRLAVEVWGIGFRTADAIAERLGIARDSPDRLDAGLIHVLGEHVEDGHAHVPISHVGRPPISHVGRPPISHVGRPPISHVGRPRPPTWDARRSPTWGAQRSPTWGRPAISHVGRPAGPGRGYGPSTRWRKAIGANGLPITSSTMPAACAAMTAAASA
jgi:ribosomal protein S13